MKNRHCLPQSPRHLLGRIDATEREQGQFTPVGHHQPFRYLKYDPSRYPTSAIRWKLVATSRGRVDNRVTRTGDDMGHAGSAPPETRVTRPSAPMPSAPCVCSLCCIVMTPFDIAYCGKKLARGSVLGSTPLYVLWARVAFLIPPRSFIDDNPRCSDRTVILPPNLPRRGRSCC